MAPTGESVVHELGGRWTLLLFLTTTCEGCLELWDEVVREAAHLPPEVALVVVTRDGGEDRGVIAARSRRATVVMSEDAWRDYQVHSGPFFVLADGRGRVRTEGVAWSFGQVAGAVTKVLAASD